MARPKQTKWDAQKVIEAIKRRELDGLPLNNDAVNFNDPPLHGAARRYFKTWKNALLAAGINPEAVKVKKVMRNVWSRKEIIRRIQAYAAEGRGLSKYQVSSYDTPLTASANHYFGGWDQAIEAAGFNPDETRLTIGWTEEKIIGEIQVLYSRGAELSVQNIKAFAPALHEAAINHFNSWEKAVEAGGFNYQGVRKVKEWNEDSIIKELQAMEALGIPLGAGLNYDSALRHAAQRHFGSIKAAYKAANVNPNEGSVPFVSRLKQARLEAGKTQNDLADLVGRTRGSIKFYENADVMPSLEMALKFARALNTTVDALFQLIE